MTDALAIIRNHYLAASRGDLDGMFADFASDGQFIEITLPAPGTYIGADAIKAQVFPAIAATYSDFRFLPEQLLADGDTVIALGRYEGTVRANGNNVRIRTCHVWTVQGGQIRRFEQIADSLGVAQALQV
jgi:hypothetical protein